MFTNGAPALKTIALTVVTSLFIVNLGKAQIVRLYPLTDYEASLRAYHTAKVKAACVEFEARTKMKWWYYLPNIGFQFGLPSVTAGTSQLITIDQTKQQNRVKLAAIITQGLLDYQTELHQLRSMYAAAQIERDAVDELNTSWNTENKIFEIAKEAHQKQEINPVDYYQALLKLQKEYSASKARYQQYTFRVIELAKFARHQFPTERLQEIDSLFVEKKTTLVKTR
ncbi:hypothetical protein GO730_38775 [Spirosoma sp. HMF3257]|uniref:TolC family protein n=1 Tax=Spirosoma telluris TaxID=2183553 RepID=A0A327NCB9_9BACT|nr:hypothetical protein [Spirosoma telluris]RAI72847.1 hypothetical protein HMF3257_38700 [Spirosoma telluris]